MITVCEINLLDEKCPDNKTEQNCSLREYIGKSPLFMAESNHLYTLDVFHLTLRNNLNREELIQTYDEMHAICKKCKADKQKTK